MDPIMIILIVAAALVLGGLVFSLFFTNYISRRVFDACLVREDKDKWEHECSAPENEEQMAMWNAGCQWAEGYSHCASMVEIENEGLRLVGEYMDLGSDKAVIILPGRCECYKYSYYFAKPYADMGVNVLVIDTRCHGYSDGKYSTVGDGEGRDALMWAKFLKEQKGNRKVFIHGVCIGGAAAIYATTEDRGEKYIDAICTEGTFINFRETFKNHMIADKHPVYPVLDMVMCRINRFAGTNVYKRTPYKAVPDVKVPALFIFGEKDIYSVPKMSKKLFDACGSEKKELFWLPKGGHSHLRINNLEAYDNKVREFISSVE